MRNERLETLVVVSGYPIDAVAAERSPYTAEPVFVRIGRVCHKLIDGGEVVAHTLSSVVAAYLFVPFHAEAGQSSTVRRYNDVVVCRHHHKVPTETPELADGRLRSSLAVEQGGVFLVRVEMWRIDYPCQHLFAVGRGLPARLHTPHLYLVVDVLVLKG